MPADKTAVHPSGLRIEFNEARHAYTDERGVGYRSVTQIIGRAFAPFDADGAAAKKAEREGLDPEVLKRQWKQAGDLASRNGTRAHENCENQILGHFDRMHQPADDAERLRFRACWHRVEELQAAGYDSLQPEVLVFSPRFMAAGSIDLLCRRDNCYDIYDWKFVKELKRTGFRDQRGIIPATAAMPDSNYWHYALQLAVYEQILRLENYIPTAATVTRTLNVYLPGAEGFEAVSLPDLRYEALLLLAWNVTGEHPEELPF